MVFRWATPEARRFGYRALTALVLLAALAISLVAEAPKEHEKSVIAGGWHPWYEIKADPESTKSLIICGTKWDPDSNGPFGFVYASADGGVTWQTALEDKATAWVSEHSCAFGPDHKAYFVSGASTVVDGTPRHERGATRLFVSNNGGRNWEKRVSTGWADYSTSAVSSAEGRLYTFFNSWNTADTSKGWGSSVGLLVFSANGRQVSGPFLDSTMRTLHYRGVFPSNAIALRDGSVIASYYATRRTSSGSVTDVGIVRANSSLAPSVKSTIISRRTAKPGRNCGSAGDSSLAYDSEHDRLFLLYFDRCAEKREMMLTQSSDEGRTWSSIVAISSPHNQHEAAYAPSLLMCPGNVLGLLWQEGEDSGGRWLFSYLRGHELLGPPLELSHGSTKYEVSNDSLWTWLSGGRETGTNDNSGSSIMLNVSSQPSTVWRARGLVAVGSNVLAAWPQIDTDGMQLCLKDLGHPGGESQTKVSADVGTSSKVDLTRETLILYGGKQHFDRSKGTLKICLTLKNRGRNNMMTPIQLQAEDIKSAMGPVSILNATNELPGVGAIWDISSSVTGDRIPPEVTSNPFCLAFHLNIERPDGAARSGVKSDLLTLRLTVLGRHESLQHRDTQSY